MMSNKILCIVVINGFDYICYLCLFNSVNVCIIKDVIFSILENQSAARHKCCVYMLVISLVPSICYFVNFGSFIIST
jgi:hypothetical protein